MYRCDTVRAIRAKKLELARIDPRGGMPVLPPPGASPAAIEATERRLGFSLPTGYRAFLEQHDGWPRLFHGASLLGVHHLARGTYVNLARLVVEESALLCSAGAGQACVAASFIPFGIDANAEIVVGWDTAAARSADGELPITVWVNGIGDVVESFDAFLDLILGTLSADVDERRSRAVAPGAGGPEVGRTSPLSGREPSSSARGRAA